MTDEVVRIRHDNEVCMGIGTCESVAEDLFRLDDDGNLLAATEAPAGRRADVEAAVNACPTGALSLLP